ncbi:MAG: hypothetical protein ACRCS8_05280 [Brevinema sp.]
MKKLLLLFTFLVISGQTFAAVGTHNFVFKASGQASMGYHKPIKNAGTAGIDGKPYTDDASMLGGGFNIGLGYQYYSEKGNTIHGVDFMTTIGMAYHGIANGYSANFVGAFVDNQATDAKSFTQIYGTLSTTYSVGRKLDSGRFMIDAVGLNIALGGTSVKMKEDTGSPLLNSMLGITDTSYRNFGFGKYLGLGLVLPLGFQYVGNNGFVFGVRHSMTLLFPVAPDNITLLGNNTESHFLAGENANGNKVRDFDYFDYKIDISLGFMIGK